MTRSTPSTIWYSACNEDSASEIAVLRPVGKRVLCITASGSRAFDLLLADPAHVTAIDHNPAQTALAALFAVAYRQLDYPTFGGFIGLSNSPDRQRLLELLLPSLPDQLAAFWRANRHLADDGVLYCGRWEGFLRRFRRWAGPGRRDLADRLLRCADIDEQWSLWREAWDNRRWRWLLRALATRPLWRWGLREPGIGFVPRDFDLSGYARARFDHAARHLLLARLPFAWLLFSGSYRADVLPPYLTEAGHATIRDRLDRLTLRTTSLREAIDGAEPGTFDAASLSDFSSYCDLDEQRRLWRGLAIALAPGASVCERKFFNKTGTSLPIEHGFVRDDVMEQRLEASDGAWFYSFVAASRIAA